ncbi:MAG: 7-carboxy-7-deazaguanine synthase QueE [Gemmatimonadota bacterium]|nr:7-carboxy-7-deazaguanine synthase QueE [Gemmatimonadota bacterium]MDH3427805.1 7-carboxy-7-deazaguanine synthase QueE [Gemmatimonadota bacterium]
MRVTEIFHSIQGESSYAGLPCVFVRTTGCNLRCVWCDTAYAFQGGRDMSVSEILAEVERLGGGCRLVELTGGEPLLQLDIGELAEALIGRGFTVLVETSGSVPVDRVPEAAVKIVDFKCPGSGEVESNDWTNLERMDPTRDEIKFVIADRADYAWARDQVVERQLDRFPVHFSPEFEAMDRRELAGWILSDGLPVRLQLQLHKFIWDPAERGV